MSEEDDERLARLLQEEIYSELIGNDTEVNAEVSSLLPTNSPPSSKVFDSSVVAPEWEDLDPTPDLHSLFLQFNQQFFWNRLNGCEVKWSPRMTLCAGVCRFVTRLLRNFHEF